MRIQNITGVAQTFGLGRRSQDLQVGEIISVDEHPKTIEAVGDLAARGLLRILEGPKTALASFSIPGSPTFAFKPGGYQRWVEDDTLDILGAVFEVTANDTQAVAGSVLVDIAGVNSDALVAAAFDAAFSSAAGKAALAAVGVTYAGLVTLNSVLVCSFTIATDVTALADFEVTVDAGGGTGTVPSVVAPGVTETMAPQVATVDVTVPTGKSSVVVVLPYAQVLSKPDVTVRSSAGVWVTGAPTSHWQERAVEVTGLTAGQVVTIVATVR